MKVTYRIDGPIGHITLSNPPQNALTSPVFADRDELADFLNTPTLKGVVLQGAGRHFCSGADLASLAAQLNNSTVLADTLSRGKELLQTISSATVPVVAAIRGSCLGAGLEIALACHFRFAEASAMLGFPESEHGLIPGLGGTVTGGDIVVRPVLTRLILSGDMIRAEEAATLGLVDRCVDAGQVDTKAVEFIETLTRRRSSELVRAIMTSIGNADTLPRAEAFLEETRLFCEIGRKLSERDAP